MLTRNAVRSLVRACGLDISRRDRLAELIPGDYVRSPYLPRVYRQSLGRIFYFREMVERARSIAGDFVECGVSTGHGILYFMLLNELSGQERRFFGFDSFNGFPALSENDRKADGTYQIGRGAYASPVNMVTRVLTDGCVSPTSIERNLYLVPGYFDKTLEKFQGRIALLHLDCDLYESYMTCLNALYNKVQPGGLILFDEYHDSNFPGAKRAVDEFLADKPEKPIEYHNYEYRRYFVEKSSGNS